MRVIRDLPLFVILAGIGAAAMLVPAAHAFALRDYATARPFFYSAILIVFFCVAVGLAMLNRAAENSARSHLLALLGAFLALPAALALPMAEVLEDARFLNVYFEMVSAITTTGASVFDAPGRLSSTLHLWKGLVSWLGGFLFWLSAIAIMAPLNLGGFEVLGTLSGGQAAPGAGRIPSAEASDRLMRYAVRLLPIYLGLTLVLWVGLILAGDPALVALCHAMAAISTSGQSPVGGMAGAGSGIAGELLIFVFLFFAVSRVTFSSGFGRDYAARLLGDREFQFAVWLVTLLPLALFLRHWIGAFEVNEQESLGDAARALWGGMFTVLSFMTTAGFESSFWVEARNWSGLATPGLLLMGLALMGGGVATTAGGVKLLRVNALYMHGIREMEKLIHPSSIGGAGISARRIRRQGAQIAWIFFMLFMISVAVVTLGLALTGLSFDSALTFAIAALSTTGPVATVAAETPLAYAALTDTAKTILVGAMVLGRLETLAIIALLNPDFWR